jgi:predicted 2-oxoglutarate/Fe(II)-dependent dioxygenase YbiX
LSDRQDLPPFQMMASTNGWFTDAEIDRLIADHAPLLTEGTVGEGGPNAVIRKSQIHFFRTEEKNEWLYQRIWKAANAFNQQFLRVDLAGIEGNIQLARYDAADHGFYTWHTDFAPGAPNRKISITVQFSRPEDYDGGDLELFYDTEPQRAKRTRGALIAFPSFVLHRVTPVTRGTRWSLVAWITGDRWR